MYAYDEFREYKSFNEGVLMPTIKYILWYFDPNVLGGTMPLLIFMHVMESIKELLISIL